jgi:formyltetrahydrofolate deformylase
MLKHVLLVSCKDRLGLIHEIAGTLLRHSLNIIENQEYVDHGNGQFFMRTAFKGAVSPDLVSELQMALPEPSRCQILSQPLKRLVVFVSKEPHCLGDMLMRHEIGEMHAKILAVVSQVEDCRELVERFGIPFHHVPVLAQGVGNERLEQEARVEQVLAPFAPDLIVLARYMRIFSPAFVSRYPEQIINIHHSFLPAFIGKDPYKQAHARGVKIIGATAHFVTDGLDEGPIICQNVISVDHSCDAFEMARRGRDVERMTFMRGIQLVLEDRVIVDRTRTIVFD